MTDYTIPEYTALRHIALLLIELRMTSGRSNDELLRDLAPMLDEDIDEF